MVTERARRQYLEAMGINLWVARHPLPNALASSLPEVEPVTDEVAPTLDHHQRLHALIDEVDHPEAPPRLTTPEPESAPRETTRPARSIKALLDHGRDREKSRADSVASPTPAAPVVDPPDTTTRGVVASPARSAHEPLRFSVQVAALDGRWLVLLARDEALSDQEETFFKAILQAGGVEPSASLSCQRFGWPMMEGLPVDDALDEARQGFKAFLAGRRARGWAPERILLFGRLPVLEEVLDVKDGQSRVLDLPFWQGPSLESLASASARRALWAAMGEWQRWWQGQIAGQDNNDA